MSFVDLSGETRNLARRLELREMARGYKQPEARKRVAASIGVAPGTLINLARGRLKRGFHDLRSRLRIVLVGELEKEIGRLQHEINLHRAAADQPVSNVVEQAETHLEEAKRLLSDARR